MSDTKGQPYAPSIGYHDRDGKPIDMQTYGMLALDDSYKIVKQTERYNILVSTVWLGMDHSFRKGDPITIFETMIFTDGVENESAFEYQERYTTEAQALEGHERACRMAFPIAVSDGSGEWKRHNLTT